MTVRILNCDVMEGLRQLPDESVHCCVTSPPYFGLRDYGVEGQIGREATLEDHINRLVGVFREVRRVLRKDGTLWLNYGDAYAGKRTPGLKPKDLMLLPARIALALQADGWWVRKEIIWHKPNPMPESCRDRPTSAHEKVYLMTKSARYFYDADSVNEHGAKIGAKGNAIGFRGGSYTNGKPGPRMRTGNARVDKQRGHSRRHAGFNDRWDAMTKEEQGASRNLRDVWTIACEPFQEAHFATFPSRLAETCIKAGCPDNGVVLDPFGGSGTTGMAAERLGRDSILIEINPDYVLIAERRLACDRLKRGCGTMGDIANAALEPTPLEEIIRGSMGVRS